MNKNVEELRTILKEYSPFEPAYKGLIDIEVLKGVLDEVDRLNNIINEIEKYSENMISEYDEAIEESVDNIDRFNLLGARSSYREISNKIKELKGSEYVMKYIVVDIGCIECGESSDILGVFTDRQKAEEVMKKCEKYQEENWYGQHCFEIFEVNKENELISQYYIDRLNKENK